MKASPISVMDTVDSNPLDLVEDLVLANSWASDWPTEDELAIEIAGAWCDYRLWFAWRADGGVLHFSCSFDMRVPKDKRAEVYHLFGLVNERMWIGHFDLWSEEGWPMFRHTLLMRGTDPSRKQVEDLLDAALSECERYYPAMQYVIWGGKSAEEAMEAALLDPVGEA